MRKLLLAILLIITGTVVAASSAQSNSQRYGYHWYEEPVKEETLAEREQLLPPPASAQLLAMHPDDLKVMLEDYLKEAVWLRTPESVLNYYKIQDAARRKASGFTAVSQMVMLQNPAMSGASQYPVNGPGRKAALQLKDSDQREYMAAARGAYALALFTTETCPYCPAQRNILKFVGDSTGFEITELDIDRRPEIQARFNVSVTPMVILIERNSDRWMPIAVGVESASKIQLNAYRAIRYLRGEVTPEQFLTPRYEQGGFFDPTM